MLNYRKHQNIGLGLLILLFSGCADMGLPPELMNVVENNVPQNVRSFITPETKNAVQGISLEEEIAIGREVAGRLLGAAPLVKDDKAQKYVNAVGAWVAAQAGRPEITWRFGIIDSPDINSFATPGGYIFITKGLYNSLSSESQLAGVLGHEIAHVVKKHHIANWKKSNMLAGLEKIGSAKAQQGVGVAIGRSALDNILGNGAEILARGLDRSAEEEADRLGILYATQAGYSPWGLVEILQAMEQISPSDSSVALLFQTHPRPEVRLNALSAFMGNRFDDYAGYEGTLAAPLLAEAGMTKK